MAQKPASQERRAPVENLPSVPITTYRTVSVDGLKLFYREAGDPKAPAVLLLHGFPTSLEEIYDHANSSSVCCPRFYGRVRRAVPRRRNRLGKGRHRARQDRVSTRQCPPLRHTAQ